MLVAALEKRNAIDELTERRKNRVTTHKLSDAEWRIAEELNPILTVRSLSLECSQIKVEPF